MDWHVAQRHLAGCFLCTHGRHPHKSLFGCHETIGFGTALRGKQVTFGLPLIHFSGMALHIPEEGECIRLLGRHALPHVFHRQDVRKLMASCRRAVAPISMGTLPAHYPIHMYKAVASGVQRWSSVVRPLRPRAMRLANLPVASLLRNFWNINADHSLELFLQSVTFGWTGLCSALPTMVLSFMSTYQHQLNHPNPHFKASTRHGLLQALTRFHRDMPCLQQGILHLCLAHSDNHSLFVIWCHRLSVDLHVPLHQLPMPLLQCPLYQATFQWQVEDTHLWMAVPYHSQDQAIRLGWPVRFHPTSFPIPFSDDISALTPHLPHFSMAPSDTVFLQDASWFPIGRHSGGVVAVLDVHTGHSTLHRIPIPIFCDKSY